MFKNYPAINVNKRTNFSKTIIEEKTMSTYTDTITDDFKICQDLKDNFFISHPTIVNTIIDLYAIKDSKITNLFYQKILMK